jgi:hypothetical protein
MKALQFLIVAAVVAVAAWELIEPWRQRRRWQRHRDRQNRDIDREMRPQ